MEDDILLEVLDPATDEPVADGQPGEMVLTSLTKQARPMIRFRTGDIIVADHSPAPAAEPMCALRSPDVKTICLSSPG